MGSNSQLPVASKKDLFTGNYQLATIYPCFCLCLVFVQITRTIPLRRTILQFSQILLTLLLTFMAFSLANRVYDRRIVNPSKNLFKPQAPAVTSE
jgi:hypothetical protein